MTPKMNPQVKTKWLAALKSGKYTKINHSLCDVDKANCHCTMGVLWAVAAEEGVIEAGDYSFDAEKALMEWSQLKEVVLGPYIEPFKRIADANDDENDNTFDRMIKLVEEFA